MNTTIVRDGYNFVITSEGDKYTATAVATHGAAVKYQGRISAISGIPSEIVAKMLCDGLQNVHPAKCDIIATSDDIRIHLIVSAYTLNVDTVITLVKSDGTTAEKLEKCERECVELRKKVDELSEVVKFLPWLREAAEYLPGYAYTKIDNMWRASECGIEINCGTVTICGTYVIVDYREINFPTTSSMQHFFHKINPSRVGIFSAIQFEFKRFVTGGGIKNWSNLVEFEAVEGEFAASKLLVCPKLEVISVKSLSCLGDLRGSSVKVLKYRDENMSLVELAGSGIQVIKI